MVDLQAALSECADEVERMMDLLLPQPEGPEARLYEAMRHSRSPAASGCGRSW